MLMVVPEVLFLRRVISGLFVRTHRIDGFSKLGLLRAWFTLSLALGLCLLNLLNYLLILCAGLSPRLWTND